MKHHVFTYNHDMRPEQMSGVCVMLRSLHRFAPEASIHAVTGAGFDVKLYPHDVSMEVIPMPRAEFADKPRVWTRTLATLDGRAHGIAPSDYVWVVDMRDLYFQGNPFIPLLLEEPRVSMFAESSFYPCLKERANALWQRTLHNGHPPPELVGRPILCFGTHAGRWHAMQAHFNRVNDTLWSRDPFIGGDQSVQTTLGWTRPDLYAVHSNEDGPVLHCVLQPPVRESFTSSLVYNMSGGIPAVVHQYDRYPSLLAAVTKEYL